MTANRYGLHVPLPDVYLLLVTQGHEHQPRALLTAAYLEHLFEAGQLLKSALEILGGWSLHRSWQLSGGPRVVEHSLRSCPVLHFWALISYPCAIIITWRTLRPCV